MCARTAKWLNCGNNDRKAVDDSAFGGSRWPCWARARTRTSASTDEDESTRMEHAEAKPENAPGIRNPRGRRKSARLHPGECKISGCARPSMGTRYHRLCREHFSCANGDRGTCERKGCKAPRCQPYGDAYCEQHHPGMANLTTHEKIMMDRVLAGVPISQIAAEVGITPSAVSAKLSSPSMRAVVERASEKVGLTTERVMGTLKATMEADKIVLSRDRKSGQPVPITVGPDWDTRLRAAEMVAKLLGLFASVSEQDVNTAQLTMVVLPPQQTIALNHPVKVLEANAKRTV